MSFIKYLTILIFITQYVVSGRMNFIVNKPVCKFDQSSVNTASVFGTLSSRSFLHCVTECSQDSTCQSVFYDKTTKLCYWNNNNPVVATSCGSLRYLQLYSTSSPPSPLGCCPFWNNETLVPETSSISDQVTEIYTTEVSNLETTTAESDGFITLPNSGIIVYFETVLRTNHGGATSRCNTLNARLVIVDSAQKQDDLKTYMSNSGLQGSFYIGVKYSGGWKWNDGSSVSYNAWGGSSFGSYCGAIESSLNYKWKKIWCAPLTNSDQKHFICERLP